MPVLPAWSSNLRTRCSLLPAIMRRCYLVCYDIRNDKRLRGIFKLMKGYGEHWQYSIFFCVLRPIDRVRMQGELEDIMNQHDDQVLIIDLGENQDSAARPRLSWARRGGYGNGRGCDLTQTPSTSCGW